MGMQGFEPRFPALEAGALPGWTTSPMVFLPECAYLKVTTSPTLMLVLPGISTINLALFVGW